MKRTMRLFAALALLPLVVQGQKVPTLGETMDVSIVNVDVFVTDKQGNRVRGLTKNDFEIYENGKLQPISNFSEYRGDAAGGTVGVEGGAAAAAEVAPPQKRTLVVFFELMRLSEYQSKPLVAEIKKLVRSTIRTGDSVTLVLWSPEGALQTNLHGNVASIERALDAFAARTDGAELNQISQLRHEVADIMLFQQQIEAIGAAHGMPAAAMNSEQTQREFAAETAMARSMMEMKRRVAAINATINSISAAEGKKILLLATHRLGEVAGGEYVLASGQPASFLVKQKYGTQRLVKSIIDNANASAVTIYPIYAPGLREEFADAGEVTRVDPAHASLVLQNEMVSLEAIARGTGGMTAWGADAVKLLPRIQEDVADYYSLAYRVSGGRADRARGITVKTKNRDYEVRSRREFVEKTDTTRMKDRVIAALFRPAEDATIAITTEAGAPAKSGRRETVPLKVRVPIGALTMLPQGNGKYSGSFSVYVATGAKLEEVSEVTIRTQPFEIAEADLARAKASHFTYNLDVVVNSRAERVAVGVLDEVGKTFGLARVEIGAGDDQRAAK
jgi:VWFA-related protein